MSKGQASAKQIAERIRKIIDESNTKRVKMPMELEKVSKNKPGSALYFANLFLSKK
jgi:hypothetical protein